MQKIVLITTGPDGTRGLAEVNEHLRTGWLVEHVAPMGGGGASGGYASLVVLSRHDTGAGAVLEQMEEEMEEAAEGDGADPAVSDLTVTPGDEIGER